MAKYDPDRIAETAEPYAPGTSGVEPLCDEFGRLVAAPVGGGGGGGGGGDASAAKQDEQTLLLQNIADQTDQVEPKLEEMANQGRACTSGSLVLLDLAPSTADHFRAAPSPRGFLVKVPSTATDSVFFGYASYVSTTGTNVGYEVEPGGEFDSDLDNTNKLYAICASAVTLVARIEVRS
jgi:hypothetical protein